MTRAHILRAGIDARQATLGGNEFVRATNRMAQAVRGYGAAFSAAQIFRVLARYETQMVGGETFLEPPVQRWSRSAAAALIQQDDVT